MKNLQIAILMIVAVLTLSTPALAVDAIEIDTFARSWLRFDMRLIDGTTLTIDLYGPSEFHVFFEGPTEGDADDDNSNSREEVPTEIVSLKIML